MAIFCIKEEIVYLIFLLLLIFYIKNKGIQEKKPNNPIIINKIINKSSRERVDPLLSRDHAVLNNPLAGPFRRLGRHIYTKNNLPFNYPTRGITDNFQYMGNLIRHQDERIVKLFGRQKYPGSTEYEYYGILSEKGGSQIKVQISNKKELYTGDSVIIPLLKNNSFKVQLHKLAEPRYNPYI